MGIRFACHVCNQPLNIKRELAGRRGICPACSSRIRIPLRDTDKSTAVDSDSSSSVAVGDMADAGRSRNAGAVAVTSILDHDTEAQWYVRPPTGGQYGPASGTLLKQWIDEGRVSATALLWREGWPHWRAASEALPEWSGKLTGSDAVAARPSVTLAASPGMSADASEPAAAERVGPLRSGQASIELQRRQRTRRRFSLIAILAVLALALVGGLLFVVTRA